MNAFADWAPAVYAGSAWVLPVLFAVTFHEAAHGYAALRFGDDTARRAGRLSLNPLRHVDTFGTIVLPALLILLRSPFLFGYAKPVPVDFSRLNRPRRDMVWVALAGPGTNVLLAIVAGLLFTLGKIVGLFEGPLGNPWVLLNAGLDQLPPGAPAWIAKNLANAWIINALLCVFNLLPLPPLDGGRVAVGLLPDALAFPLARLEPLGIPILLLLIFLLPYVGSQFGLELNIFGLLIAVPAELLIRFVLAITGHPG
ncbi:MAG: site-2 protease family protein [Alphaproteobacteria bacterium]